MKFRDHLNERMKNPEFAAEYKALEPEYEIIEQLIRARAEKNLTQKELAEITGSPRDTSAEQRTEITIHPLRI